jgi:hypothetical protein
MSIFKSTVSYHSKETGVSIQVPKSWTGKVVDEKTFRMFGEKESGFEDHFDEYRPTMSYQKVSMELGDKTKEDFVKENNQKMQADYNQYKQIKEKWFKISDRNVYVKEYEWTDTDTKLELAQLQAIIFVSPYSILLINAAVIKKIKEKYMSAFNSVLESTRIIP